MFRTFIVSVAEIPAKEIELTVSSDEFDETNNIESVLEDMLNDEYVDYIEPDNIKLTNWRETTDEDAPQTPPN